MNVAIRMDFARKLWVLVCDGEPLISFTTYERAKRFLEDL